MATQLRQDGKAHISTWVEPWVRDALRLAAFRKDVSLTAYVGQLLTECCADDKPNNEAA